jgi:Xaa-Pro aminopeptidase
MEQSPFHARRQRVLESLGDGSVMIVPSARVFSRNSDVEHPYRQDSDFHYLTGFDEPDSVALLTTVHAEHKFVLFCRKRDREREIWDGYRAGVEGAVSTYGADVAYPIEELDQRLAEYLENVDRVHHRLGKDRAFDDRVLRAIDVVRSRFRKGVFAPNSVVDPTAILHPMRFIKDDSELDLMRRAAAISRDAHVAAMKLTSPGRREFEIDAELLRVFRMHGSERPAYESICGSGPNATILHYRAGNREMQDGELLLVDAGCELGSYASDVTRTYPVNGVFSDEQRALYQITLDAQLAAIEATVPGTTLDAIHDVTVKVLVAGMIRVGLLEGEVDERIADESYRKFYMHRTSHWLGMDVHDVGGHFVRREPRRLEPGCVLTIEPGIYVAPDAEVDAKWRGIGIRIEDDLLVTATGSENLTAAIPKTVEDIEAVMRR